MLKFQLSHSFSLHSTIAYNFTGSCTILHPMLYSSILLFLVQFVLIGESRKLGRPLNKSLSTIVVFGDSTVDPGNNNHIATAFRSNFPPYGLNFPGKIPTGRFCDGRLVTDFIASYLGIKENVPAYLDPKLKLQDLTTGVSFASAGSGLDPLTTALTGVIPMQRQLQYFKEYKWKLQFAIGKKKMETLISRTAFIVSVGVNDLAISYYLLGLRKINFDINGYQQFLLQILHKFLQDIRKEGARGVAVVGQPPLGCVPVVITVTSNGQQRCNETLSAIGFGYNQKLKKMLKKMDGSKFRVVYADIYGPIIDMVKHPPKYGFDKVDVACCGSGLLEMSFLCNLKSPICKNPSKYLFFDSAHATEATYKYVFQSLRPTIDKAIAQFPY